MKNITLYIAAALSLCALPACSDKSEHSNTAIDAKDLIQIDMVATHAIDTEVSVAQLTFVPNSVAPWLGRVILLDDDGHLYSTDIEGRAPKPVGSGTYIDIFGLARNKAAGVFLAITKDNKIEAFIESDDNGNFSPMIYSGTDETVDKFCPKHSDAQNKMGLITTKSNTHDLTFQIIDDRIETSLSTPFPKDSLPEYCQYTNATMSIAEDKFAIIPSTSRASLYIAKAQPVPLDQKVANVQEGYRVNITNGLSVRGLEHVKFITSTQSNYGGGAYADGVLALVDKDANRIVFISLSYVERQLLKAVNPPPNDQEETP